MFDRAPPGPSGAAGRWWPAWLGAFAVAATVVTVVTVLVTLRYTAGSTAPKRQAVVTFMDRGEALAAQTSPPPRGTEVVLSMRETMIVLSMDEGVTNAEVALFYDRSVLVEDDPILLSLFKVTGTGLGWNATAIGLSAVEIQAGHASDMANGIVWAASEGGARVLLLAGRHRGECPSYLQAAISGAREALAVAPSGDGGAENLPSNCAGVLSVGEAQGAGIAHLRAETPDAAAWVARLAAGAWRGNETVAALRARVCESATSASRSSVYGTIPAGPTVGAANSTAAQACPIDTYQSGARCAACPSRSYAGRGWSRCEACKEGVTTSCGYDCLTCGIVRG